MPAPPAPLDSRKVLKGIRIADFSWVGVGPIATMGLAFLGADVIRVESTLKTDTLRNGGPYRAGTTGIDRSAYYANFNRDKRGMALNLRHPRALEIVMRLIAVSDVVTESFQPGFLQEIGLTYEAARAVRPDVIMVSMSMEGQDGPHSSYKGFGLTLQGTAGITHLTGWPDRAPVGTGVAYTDWFATHVASVCIQAALDHRRRTGEGQYIDMSQLEAMTLALDATLLEEAATGHIATRAGNMHAEMAPHGVYPVRGEDRWIAIAAPTDEAWRALVAVLDRDELAADSTLASTAARLHRRVWLDEQIAAATATWDGDRLAELLQAGGVPAYPVLTMGDMETDPQLAARGQYWSTTHPVIGECTWDAPGFQLQGTPLYPRNPAPLLGQHNEQIYRDLLGYSEDEFIDLMVDGAIQ